MGGENFGEFGKLPVIRQNFLVQNFLLWNNIIWHKWLLRNSICSVKYFWTALHQGLSSYSKVCIGKLLNINTSTLLMIPIVEPDKCSCGSVHTISKVDIKLGRARASVTHDIHKTYGLDTKHACSSYIPYMRTITNHMRS